MAFLMLQQLFGGLHELVAHVTLKHPGDEVYLQMALKHVLRLADKVAKNAFEPWKDRSWVYGCMGQRDRRAGVGPGSPSFPSPPSYPLPGTVPSIRALQEVRHTALETMSHSPPSTGCKSSRKNVLGSNICLPTSLLMWAYSPDWVIPPEWRRLRRPACSSLTFLWLLLTVQ